MDVIIDKIHQLTPSIRSFELISTSGLALPPFEAGAHIDVHLKNGLIRQYSLSNCSSEKNRYVIGVLHDEQSRGGSRCMHNDYNEGDLLSIGQPRNLFSLHTQMQKAVLFAGGIGITPILSMSYRLKAQGIPFELHYFVRSYEMLAFYGNLTKHFADQAYFHIQDQADTQCNIEKVLQHPDSNTHLYVCGPTGFMKFVMNSAETAGWQEEQLHQEHFVAPKANHSKDEVFTLEIKGTNCRIKIQPEQTVSQALLEHGFDIPISCELGICGTCITRVISGIPDHRDIFMTNEERALNNQFTPCCSRSKSKHLIIEL